MDDADASRARADEDVWPDADFATGEGDARTSGEGASASETFKTSLTDDPAFAMALRAEEDESVEMVPLASAAVKAMGAGAKKRVQLVGSKSFSETER